VLRAEDLKKIFLSFVSFGIRQVGHTTPAYHLGFFLAQLGIKSESTHVFTERKKKKK
jgi:hypothetical protein